MLSRGQWLVLAAALLAAAATARLGFWQLDRAAQKAALQASVDARGRLPALAPADLATTPDQAQAQHFRPVVLQGRWLGQHTVFLDNRQMGGRPGFLVVTPMRLVDGSAVLVQRGWLPRNFIDREALPQVATPDGELLLPGRVAPPPGKLFEFAPAEGGRIRQNLDLEVLEREIQQRLRPMSVQQLEPSRSLQPPAGAAAGPAVDDGLLRQWPAPAADLGKHHGYAFQWFALCALITGLYVWFQIVSPRRR
jgi:surfeit locus 1 family protein